MHNIFKYIPTQTFFRPFHHLHLVIFWSFLFLYWGFYFDNSCVKILIWFQINLSVLIALHSDLKCLSKEALRSFFRPDLSRRIQFLSSAWCFLKINPYPSAPLYFLKPPISHWLLNIRLLRPSWQLPERVKLAIAINTPPSRLRNWSPSSQVVVLKNT